MFSELVSPERTTKSQMDHIAITKKVENISLVLGYIKLLKNEWDRGI